MNEHVWIKPMENSDLKVYQYGHEDCKPSHSYGPTIRDHYLLHFIRSGRGTFYCENKSYELTEGQGFLIIPGITTSYCADDSTPWSYSWIGFNGAIAEYYLNHTELNQENPIFEYNQTEEFENIFSAFRELNRGTIVGQIKMISNLYMLLALILENTSRPSIQGKAFFNSKEEYIKNAVDYIQSNFSRKLTVQEITDYIGLNRSYFGTIFKEVTNMSPQDFIIKFRMDKAKKLLLDMSMNIGDVARSVGYDDPLGFSKIFKKTVGVSPNAYRKNS